MAVHGLAGGLVRYEELSAPAAVLRRGVGVARAEGGCGSTQGKEEGGVRDRLPVARGCTFIC